MQNRRRKIVILRIVGALIAISVACGACYLWLIDIDLPSPEERAILETQEILDSIEDHRCDPTVYPKATVPQATVLPGLDRGPCSCMEVLSAAMARNDNQYELHVIGIAGEWGTPTGHGATEALVEVKFPDGTRVTMQYYNWTFEWCPEYHLED
jgi:hypothetical protein